MKSTTKKKKGRGRPKGTPNRKTLKNSIPKRREISKSVSPYYPIEDIVYSRVSTEEKYAKVAASMARLAPNQAIFVPKADMNDMQPTSFASGARTYLGKDRRTSKLRIVASPVKGANGHAGIRFYRLSDTK